jgi:drug/metabolite transporter (DMT)-like permease
MVRDTKGAPGGVALAFVCLLLLGLMPVITNGRPAGFGALTFALVLSAWQLLFSLPLLIVEWRRGERGMFRQALPRAHRRRVLAITLFTGLLFALSTWAYVAAFEKAGSVNAAIALQAYPLCAAGLEALLFGRGKSWTELGFTALILIALYELATQGTWQMSGLTPWFALALAVPVLWSIAHVILRELLVTTSITPNQVTTSRLVVTILFLLPLAVAIEGAGEIARAAAALRFETFGLLMGLAYYLELVVWFNAVRSIDVSVASSITVPAPAVTMLLAWLLLGEDIHGFQLLALGLVGIGLFGLLGAGLSRGFRSAPTPPRGVLPSRR